jgi:hypothetical protein
MADRRAALGDSVARRGGPWRARWVHARPPLEYAWAPLDKDFEHGPYWGLMLAYMALFGLTGLTYKFFSVRAKEVQPRP